MFIGPTRTLWFLGLNMGYYKYLFALSTRNSFPEVKICSVTRFYFTLQATAWTFMFKKRCWHPRNDAPGKRMEVNEMFQSIGTGFSSADRKYHLHWPGMGTCDVGPEKYHLRCSSCSSSRVWCKFGRTDLISTDNYKVIGT